MMKKIFIFILLGISLLGCVNYIDMQPVMIKEYSPAQEFIYDPSADITVRFSKAMNRKATESAFNLSEDGNKMTGFFSWEEEDALLRFKPKKAYIYGKQYEVTISNKAEDNNGNDLKENFKHVFRLGADKIMPYIRTELCLPVPNAHLTLNQIRQPIEIVFSEPMDKKYPYHHITIDPDISGQFVWLDENDNTADPFTAVASSKLMFFPAVDYTKQKYYTLTANTTFTDLNGNNLREKYEFKFYIGDDFTVPQIESLEASKPGIPCINSTNTYWINSGIEKDTKLNLTFSKEMNKEETEKAVEFTPSIDKKYSWIDNRHLSIEFNGNLEWNKTYRLIINRNAKDLIDNELDQIYTYNLLITGPNSQPPVIHSIRLQNISGVNANEIIGSPEYQAYKQFKVDCTDWDLSGDNVKMFSFIYDFQAASPMNLISLCNNLSFSNVGNHGTTLTLKYFEYLGSGSLPGYYSYRFGIEAGGSDQGGISPDAIIIMSLTGGNGNVKDNINNFMAETFSVYMIFDYTSD